MINDFFYDINIYKYEIKSMKYKIRNKLNLALFNNKNKNDPLMTYKQ